MRFEDCIYVLSLLTCVGMGHHFKGIEEIDVKKSYGTGIGLLVMCLVCRQYFIHSIFMVVGNIAIFKYSDKHNIHQLSLVFTFLYLIGIQCYWNISKYMAWMFQGLALRLVGLAFELHLNNHELNNSTRKTPSGQTLKDHLFPLLDPTPLEIITYAYFFVGIHKGPYYNIKVFNDYFELPYSTVGDCRVVTVDKLKRVGICVAAYLLLRLKFPIKTYETEVFYSRSSSEYRFLYNIPQLAQYFLHQQIIVAFCTCVFTETGFGIYPSNWLPRPGLGPSVRQNHRQAADTQQSTDKDQYNFSMLTSFENERLLFGPMMKDSLRAWDMPTQYWFWAYIYKSLVKSNKEVRSATSFLAWTLWCGPTVAQIILSITLWIYVNLEAEYNSLYQTTSMKIAWDIGYSIMRSLCILYLTPCLILNDYKSLFKYYNSIYWSFHLLLLMLIATSVALFKNREVSI